MKIRIRAFPKFWASFYNGFKVVPFLIADDLFEILCHF